MEKKKGGFVIRNGHSKNKQKGQYSSPDSTQMSEVLLFYENVEYIRTSVKRGKNYVDYIVRSQEENRRCFYSQRIHIYILYEMLPEYFIRVNRSEIINAFCITGRSGTYLFIGNKEFKIGATYKKEVNEKLNLYFHPSRKDGQ